MTPAAIKAAIEGLIADLVFELEAERGPPAMNSGNASRHDRDA